MIFRPFFSMGFVFEIHGRSSHALITSWCHILIVWVCKWDITVRFSDWGTCEGRPVAPPRKVLKEEAAFRLTTLAPACPPGPSACLRLPCLVAALFFVLFFYWFFRLFIHLFIILYIFCLLVLFGSDEERAGNRQEAEHIASDKKEMKSDKWIRQAEENLLNVKNYLYSAYGF